MLLTKEVSMLITSRNAKYYQDKGYIIPKKISPTTGREAFDVGKEIFVNVEDLPECSKATVQYKCDCCGEIKDISIYDWRRRTCKELGDCCKSCATRIKLPKVMEQKYGQSNAANIESFIDKKKQTNIARYGVEWATASDEVKQRIKDSFNMKYGTDNPMKNEDVKNKAMQTNIHRYGGKSPMCDKIVRAKSVESCLERYGVSNPYQSTDIQAKARQTLNNNGKVPTSKAERRFCSVLEEIYGKECCVPNYQDGPLTFDCLLRLNDYLIDVEYDGSYWHSARKQKDAARNAVLMKNGYKVLRVLANDCDDMPTNEQIISAVDYLVKDNHNLAFINMNN